MDPLPQPLKRQRQQALTPRTNVALNRNSYTYLIGLVLFVALIVGLVFIVWPSAHFKPVTEKICLIASPLLAIAWLVHQWRPRRGEWRRKDKLDRLKDVFVALIASGLAVSALLAVAILLTSWTFSSYATTYEYATRGHRSCEGIYVFDTELNKQIKICGTNGADRQGWVRVEKLSGPLGIFVTGTVPI